MLASGAKMEMDWGAATKSVEEVSIRVDHSMGAAGTVETTLPTSLPADAVVTSATATITLKQAGTIAAGAIAQVRQGESTAIIVVDFGALRTISALTLPPGKTLTTLRRWAGTGFASVSGVSPPFDKPVVSFAEIQTERLELGFSSAVSVASASTALLLNLPGAPTDPVVEVGGVRAWSRPGPVRLDAATAAVHFSVPLVAELQAALARGANPDIVLRTATPSEQTLSLSLAHLRVHAVALPPDGVVVGADFETEVDAFLPLPAESSTWAVVRVELTVSGRLPSWRGWPLPDPTPNTDARLVIDPGHSFAARLPATWLAPLGELSGIRLPLILPAGFAGAELSAVLYQGDLEAPTTLVAGARFVPATVAANADGGELWVALQLFKPVKVPPAATWWVEIAATRGSCEWPMTQDAAASDEIRLRRSLPGPPFRPLAVQARRGVTPLLPAGRLRIIGTPRSDDLRPAVVPLLQGSGSPQVAPGFTPKPTSGIVTLTPDPATPATAARGEIAANALRLRLRLYSAGEVAITAATVYYRSPP
jgi:hypothetical protein